MSLRLKTFLLLGLTFSLSLIALYVTADLLIRQEVTTAESATTRANAERVRQALAIKSQAFGVLLRDWSVWDDTYAFVQDEDPSYIESNLPVGEFVALQLNALVILDTQGKLVYGTGFDLKNKRLLPVPAGLQPYLVSGSALLPAGVAGEPKIGLVSMPEGAMLVGARPIVDSLETKPARGTLIFGQYFDAAQIAQLGETTHLDLNLYPWQSDAMPPDIRALRHDLTTPETVIHQPGDEQTFVGVSRIDDLDGIPLFVEVISTPRITYGFAQTALRYFLILLSTIGVVGSLSVLWLVERLVLRPVAALSAEARQIGDKSDAKARVTVQGQAELASLSRNINAMLEALDRSRRALDDERARYRAIVEGQREWIVRFLPDGPLTFVNNAFCASVHKTPAQLMGTYWFDLLPEPHRGPVRQRLRELSPQSAEYSLELQAAKPDGALQWQSWTWHGIFDDNMRLIEIQGVGADITERVLAEERSRYLSTHDALTGLYNRAYFESELERLERAAAYPISIVIGDIDHLKFLNDQYGHAAGDTILRAAATLLRKSFRSQDIVARIGGDEFAVVLPMTGYRAALGVVTRVQEHLLGNHEPGELRSLHMSLGLATAGAGDSLDKTLQLADEKMYEAKFAHRRLPAQLIGTPSAHPVGHGEGILPSKGNELASATVAPPLATDRLRFQHEQIQALSGLTDLLNRSESLQSICEATLATLRASGIADRAGILLRDPAGELRFTTWYHLSEPYRALLQDNLPWTSIPDEPFIIRDVESDSSLGTLRSTHVANGVHALCYMPISFRQEFLGAVLVCYNTSHPFGAEQQRLLHTITSQTGLALARIGHEAQQRRVQEWNDALSLLARELSTAESGEAAAHSIARAADHILHWDAFLLSMYSRENDKMLATILAMDIVNGERVIVPTPEEMESTPLLRSAVQENGILILRKPLSIAVPSTVPFGDQARPSASLIYVPIRHRSEVIGILSIQSYTYNAYDESSLEFMRTLAGHCGGALGRLQAQDNLYARTIELERAYDETIEGWSGAMELRDREIRGHAHRVAEMALQLAKRLDVPPHQLPHLRRGALLHDIGKMALPDEILYKTEPLTAQEWEKMRNHPLLAYDMLKHIAYLKPALDVPYCHHERWDGSGYPRGLRGQEIPLLARIFAIVDVWDALRSDRPYRQAWQESAILEYLSQQANIQFDPRIVRTFLEILTQKASARDSDL